MTTLLLHGGDLELSQVLFLAIVGLAVSVGIVVLCALAFRAYLDQHEQDKS